MFRELTNWGAGTAVFFLLVAGVLWGADTVGSFFGKRCDHCGIPTTRASKWHDFTRCELCNRTYHIADPK